MKLLYCSRDYTTHDLRFVRAFVNSGIEVHYLRLESDGVPYVSDALPAGASWITWAGAGTPLPPPQAVTQFLPAFTALATSLRPDLIHAGPVQSFGLMAALADIAPTVLVSWGSDILVDAGRDDWYRWASETALRRADAFLCDNAAVLLRAQQLVGDRPMPPHLCIPWGLEVIPDDRNPQRRASLRSARGWEDAVVVVATRAWHPAYRTPDLVDAFARAATSNPRLRLALAGDGDDAGAVERRIGQHGLEPLVYRPGVLAAGELSGLLEASDIYLTMVPSDGTSIALLEAMGHGLPVIVPENPGNRDWVADGVSGFLLKTASAEAWSDRILALAADPARREAMGREGKAVVRTRADWSRNTSRLIDLYRTTAKEARQRGGGA